MRSIARVDSALSLHASLGGGASHPSPDPRPDHAPVSRRHTASSTEVERPSNGVRRRQRISSVVPSERISNTSFSQPSVHATDSVAVSNDTGINNTNRNHFQAQLQRWQSDAPAGEEEARRAAGNYLGQQITLRTRELVFRNYGISSLPDCLQNLEFVASLNLFEPILREVPLLPPNLKQLQVKSDVCTALPALPECLENLLLLSHRMPSPAVLPLGLLDLTQSGNRFTTPHDLPPGLVSLRLKGNRCITPPTLPQTIQTLRLVGPQCTTPHILPLALKWLHLDGERFTTPAEFPDTLTNLHLTGPRVTTPLAFPTNLKQLSLHSDACITPAEVPELLEVLSIHGEQCRTPERLPQGLLELSLTGSLITMPSRVPETLEHLYLHSHRLTAPVLLPTSIRSFCFLGDGCTTTPSRLPATMRYLDIEGSVIDAPTSAAPILAAIPDSRESVIQIARSWLENPLPPLEERTTETTEDDLLALLPAGGLEAARAVQATYDLLTDYGFNDAPATDLQTNRQSNQQANNSPATCQQQDWRFTSDEPDVESFNGFQQAVTGTAEYRNNATRLGLIARINQLVTAMRAAPELRAICFDLAAQSIQTCGDRVAFGLDQMETARINHAAETGQYNLQTLFSIGEGFFKLHVLDQIASAAINERKTNLARERGVAITAIQIEEVETRLAFHTLLSERLNLPGVTASMLYIGCANISDEALNAAEANVNRQLNSSEAVSYLAAWKPWQGAMERRYGEAYANDRASNDTFRDNLGIKPPRMREQEWMDALDALASNERDQLIATTVMTTRRFLQERGEFG